MPETVGRIWENGFPGPAVTVSGVADWMGVDMAKGNCSICGKPATGARGWCKAHYHRWAKYGSPTHVPTPPTLEERFWGRVKKTESCWLWTAHLTAAGYGQISVDGNVRLAHRVAYQLLKGEIPGDLCLDHLCRVRSCVNPDHLEPVTLRENTRRGFPGAPQKARTHCPRGHEYDADNTRVNRRGQRSCKACEPIHAAKYREKIRQRRSSSN
ncbi:HNH endonuclease signature motif containing protein [Streptomyces sp. NPDC051310]|uniref:HNH endonuclease signature motif containing protein n=1 Tax=Streptomyces sp. NPDC051310 TaxID=3365649 RepID=UPI0037A5CB72